MRAANSIMVRQDNVQQTSGLRPSFMQRWMWRTLFTGLSFIWATTPSAQAQTCVLQGTVSVSSTNASNDRLPGASLNLTSAEPNKVTLNTVTNEHGEYKFENLLRGNYTLQVILNGFKRTTRSITIHAGINTLENIGLELADISSSVTVVTEDNELNSTESAQAPASFKQQTLQNLPLATERFQDALLTAELDPGLFRRQGELAERKEARIQQFLAILQRAIGTQPTAVSTMQRKKASHRA